MLAYSKIKFFLMWLRGLIMSYVFLDGNGEPTEIAKSDIVYITLFENFNGESQIIVVCKNGDILYFPSSANIKILTSIVSKIDGNNILIKNLEEHNSIQNTSDIKNKKLIP